MNYLDRETGEWVPFEWKTPFNHDTNEESQRTSTTCPEETLTQQHQAEEADINTIVRKFGITGEIPNIPLPPTLEEFSEIFDFQTAMNVQAEAKASFMQLPAEIRAAFYNDPHNFVSQIDEMLQEPDQAKRERNLEDLRLMGLAVQPGPVADRTTLGDLLKELQKRSTPPEGGDSGSTS